MHAFVEALLEGQPLLLNSLPLWASALALPHLSLKVCDSSQAVSLIDLQGKPFLAFIDTCGGAELAHDLLGLHQVALLLLDHCEHLINAFSVHAGIVLIKFPT